MKALASAVQLKVDAGIVPTMWPHAGFATDAVSESSPDVAMTATSLGPSANLARVAICVDNVTMLYPGPPSHQALDAVSLSIYENEFFTLLGPSGCGKTTLLRLLAGFEQPTQGDLSLDGVSLVGKMPFERPINTVFQSYALFPHMTVAENVAFGLEMQKKSATEIRAKVEEMLTLVRMSHLAARKTTQLSGGQQQRVALARSLATHPRVLLLDESLSALDSQLRKEMQVELKRLQRETGITFVFVTHDQEEALTMSDRIAVLKGGVLQQIGSPTEIYDTPANRFVAGFIGETNILKATVRGQVLEFGAAGSAPVAPADWSGELTLAVRPERMRLLPVGLEISSANTLTLQANVQNVIYMGHDTTYILSMPSQELCKVRTQNVVGAAQKYQIGDTVCIAMDFAAIRRIAD